MTNNNLNKLKNQQLIVKAGESIARVKDDVAKDPLRLNYHFMAPAYWINDPNGLIYFNGEYHMFYQHNPFAPEWGPMHWGHAKSKDLVHWKYLPIALAPSEDYELDERGGCFSGSAVDDNGTLAIVYTGTVVRDGKLIQSQCLATSTNGITFEKYEGNPIIPGPPEEGSSDFRDPKVWKHEDKWYAVLGSCKNGKGKALLYCSDDLRKWDYIGVLAESDGSMGTMWECPDFFPLGHKYVLIFSPMGMGEKKTVYLVGDMNYKTGKFTYDTLGEVDCGFEYYAPQSFLDGKGRRIIIAWLNAWDWMPWWKNFGPTAANNWCGAMSIPRIVELCDDGRLNFRPVKELEVLRGDHFRLENTEIISGVRVLPEKLEGKCLEILAEFELKSCEAQEFGFSLMRSVDGSEETVVSYNVKGRELRFDRNRSGSGSKGVRTCKLESADDKTLKLHIFVDTSCVEIFIDEGHTSMSNNIYPQPESKSMDLFSSGGRVKMLSLDIWKLKSIW